jgi:hypothetical protein
VLCSNEDANSLFGFDAKTEDEVMETITSAIPAAVMEIAAHWRRRRKPTSGGIIIDGPGSNPIKVGRNDPCPRGARQEVQEMLRPRFSPEGYPASQEKIPGAPFMINAY